MNVFFTEKKKKLENATNSTADGILFQSCHVKKKFKVKICC